MYEYYPPDADADQISTSVEHSEDGIKIDTDSISMQTEEKVSFLKLFRKQKLSVLVDCLVYAIFGMGVAFLGPTLFDLGCQTKSDLRKMNWVFFVQLLMTMAGSIFAGCLTGRYLPAHVLLCIGITGLPITMFLIPACTYFVELLINLMVMGWFMGCVDCIANLRMILRFGTNVTPFLQAMHFFYGLGAFVSPMIASRFLLNIDCSPFIDGFTIMQSGHSSKNETETIAPQPKFVDRAVHLSHSKEAFFILGSIQLVITIIVYIVICMEKKWEEVLSPVHTHASLSIEGSETHTDFQEYSGSRSLARYFRCASKDIVTLTVLSSSLLFIYDGVQSSYGDYIYSYAEKNVKGLEKSEGAVLNSFYWGAFAVGRFIAVGLSTRISASFMLFCNMSGCTAALLITLVWQTSRIAIYIGTCVLGLFLSSLSPTAMALMEQFVNVNAPITSCLVVFAALGETICPVIVGNLFVVVGPVSLLTFCFTITLVAIVIYIIMFLIGRGTSKYRDNRGLSFVWLKKSTLKFNENMDIKSTNVKYYTSQANGNKEETMATQPGNPGNTTNGFLHNY